MAAAPQLATISLLGLQTGRTYAIDVYFSDVVGGLANFDSGGGASATSDTFYIMPENVRLTDFSVVTGLTDTTKVAVVSNGVQTGNRIRYANFLNTLATRLALNIPFRAGSKLGFIQEA